MTKIENIKFKIVSKEDLDLIEPLWQKLKKHHQIISSHFQEKYQNNNFETRKQEIITKSREGKLRIELAEDSAKFSIIGYCISSISSKGEGEIDSIYIEENYRSQGMGQELMQRTLQWMSNENVEDIKITVSVGNEELLPFYQLFGFFPRHMILENKK
jgi:diamine N-acetyltransferase